MASADKSQPTCDRTKPKSLFAQASAKRLEGEALFGSRDPTTSEPKTLG